MKYPITAERTNLFAPNIHVAMAVLIKGGKSLDEIKKAIMSACLRNEILCSKIVLKENGEAFYERIATSNQTIISYDNRKHSNWISIIKEQESIPFDIFHGELIRFFLLKEDANTRLLIIAHHLAGDGISYTYLIEDIMLALSDSHNLPQKPIELFSTQSLAKKYRLSWPMRLMIRYTNKAWRKHGKVFDPSDYETIYSRYWEKRSTEILLYSLKEEEYLRVKELAKQYDVTLNSLILTAMLKVYNERADLGMAVSIRPQGYKGMANYASGIAIDYQYRTEKSYAENAREVNRLIQKKLQDSKRKYFLLQFLDALEPSLIDATYFAAFAGYEEKMAKRYCKMFGYSGKPKDLSVTNLTKLDIPMEYGSLSIEDFWFVPPLISNASRLFGIATLGNTMNITFHVEHTKELKVFKTYFDEVMKELVGENV